MQLEIVSPEAQLFSGEIESITLPGASGSFQILNNHAPIVSTLKKGEIKLKGSFDNDSAENLNVQNNKEASLEIQSGVIEMKKNKLIILVD